MVRFGWFVAYFRAILAIFDSIRPILRRFWPHLNDLRPVLRAFGVILAIFDRIRPILGRFWPHLSDLRPVLKAFGVIYGQFWWFMAYFGTTLTLFGRIWLNVAGLGPFSELFWPYLEELGLF